MGMMSLRGKETKGEKQLKTIFKFSGEIENTLIQEGPVAALPSLIIQGDG